MNIKNGGCIIRRKQKQNHSEWYYFWRLLFLYTFNFQSVSWINDSRWPEFISNSDSMPGSCSQYDDDFMDFSDTALFNSLLPPTMIDFPNPREIGNISNTLIYPTNSYMYS